MKKITILLLAAIFSLSCSVGQILPGSTATPALTATDTFTPLPTITPVTPTLTFTPTPTLVGLKTPTFTQPATDTPMVSVTPLAQITPNTLTPTVQMEGFIFINSSLSEFYKGITCEPSKVKITAQVFDRDAVKYVLLFVRFKSLTSERTGKWTNIQMETIGAGTYIHDLSSDEMLEDAFFQTAWVEYQVVSTNAAGREIGRTSIFKEKIKMLACIPTQTPTPAKVKP